MIPDQDVADKVQDEIRKKGNQQDKEMGFTDAEVVGSNNNNDNNNSNGPGF
jgi:hypothetical protein